MEKTTVKSQEFVDLCKQYGVDPESVPEIVSVEGAYKVLGLERTHAMPTVGSFPERHRKALIGIADLFIIHEAFNLDPETGELYKPNWNDGDEEKWSYWWDMEKDKNNPSGFRFVVSICDHVDTASSGGSRLCCRNEDIAKFIGQHFSEVFRDVMVFQD